MHKLTGAFLCLLLALPLGGIGALAAWSTGKTLWDAQRARDWVRVRVDVMSGQLGATPGGPGSGHFAYAFDGRRYEGRRLGLGRLGGNDDIDAWRAEMAEPLAAAKAAGQFVSVWVDPDDPAESVLDRSIPWHQPILLGLLVLGFGVAGIGAFVAATKMALGTASSGAASNAGSGAFFLWVFAVVWNAMAFGIGWLALAEILESREWAGLLVLLFPSVGILLIWGAAGATVNLIKVRFAGAPGDASREPSRAPAGLARGPGGTAGAVAAQAARAMFDPHRNHAGAAAPVSIDLPASVAQVAVLGGVLTVRFSRRRWLSTAIMVFAVGAVLTLVGAFMMIDESIGVGAMLVFALATAAAIRAVALLVGSLVVRARAGEIAVDKGGLFGSKSWQLQRESIKVIQPVLSHTVNNEQYFTVRAVTTSGEKVVLGDSLKGESLAERYASRLASAAGFPSDLVRAAAHSASEEY